MKISERWLREWTDPAMDTAALVERLTLAGLEVDSVETVGEGLTDVVVAEIAAVEPHPNADRLRVCRVTADGEELAIVCGAPNARAGLKSALARVGTALPGGTRLRRAKLRGVVSEGMLCSAAELGLGDDHEGILELAADAPAGASLAEHLGLPDAVIDLDLTPNRGDCFSVLGVAREVASFTGAPLEAAHPTEIAPQIDDRHPVVVAAPAACPRFVGRVIRGVDPAAHSPLWLREHLRRVGLRAISPVVDVTNYVMMELGQPLHAYDLDKLCGALQVRMAARGEPLRLLDGREVALDDDVLAMADDSGAIGLAGIMGGESTAVTGETTEVLLEGAFFAPTAIAGRARRFGLHTDASLRFERGVDPEHQRRAIERATELLCRIAGGSPGPVTETAAGSELPERPEITLRRERLARLLGVAVEDAEVAGILERLQFAVAPAEEGWRVRPPGFRFDVAIEADLIEEVGRIYGYDRIPIARETATVHLPPVSETRVPRDRLRTLFADRGYHEAVSYAFVDPGRQQRVLGEPGGLRLANPLSSEHSVMRLSLLPGLLQAAETNLARQHARVRLFELGVCFEGDAGQLREVERLAAVACGPHHPEHWDAPERSGDLFDIKSDLLAAAGLAGNDERLEFHAAAHPALHPGRSAGIRLDSRPIGWLGALHPALARDLGLHGAEPVAFEIDLEPLRSMGPPRYEPVSRHPRVRRDLAVIVDESVPAAELASAARRAAGPLARDVLVFDIYRGKGVEPGRKSVALGLILQETSRTLTDDEADDAMRSVVRSLEREFAAKLRE